MARDELVQGVDDRGCSERSQQAPEGAGKPQLFEERHAASAVARYRCAVAKDEPPAFAPRLLRDGCEEIVGGRILERQQTELFAAIERGDDTRRPAAELSAAGIEQDRAT